MGTLRVRLRRCLVSFIAKQIPKGLKQVKASSGRNAGYGLRRSLLNLFDYEGCNYELFF